MEKCGNFHYFGSDGHGWQKQNKYVYSNFPVCVDKQLTLSVLLSAVKRTQSQRKVIKSLCPDRLKFVQLQQFAMLILH